MFRFWTAFQFEVFGTWNQNVSKFFDIFNYDNTDLSQSWWWKRERDKERHQSSLLLSPRSFMKKRPPNVAFIILFPITVRFELAYFAHSDWDRLSLWYACQSPIIKWAIATNINQVSSCGWRQNQLLAQSLSLIMSPIPVWLKTSPKSVWKWEQIHVPIPNVEKVIILLDLLYPKHISICYQGKSCF